MQLGALRLTAQERTSGKTLSLLQRKRSFPGIFISSSLVSSLSLPVEEIVSVRALDEQLLSNTTVTHVTVPLKI